jgi:hypothetical protein
MSHLILRYDTNVYLTVLTVANILPGMQSSVSQITTLGKCAVVQFN